MDYPVSSAAEGASFEDLPAETPMGSTVMAARPADSEVENESDEARTPEQENDAFASEVEDMCQPGGAFDRDVDDIPAARPCEPQPSGEFGGQRLYDKSVKEYTSREIGREGERLAASYLVRRGYTILERNWRTKVGEADIVAIAPKEGECSNDRSSVVLVEVKTRLALEEANQMPELAVDRRTQLRYRRLALMYLALHPECESIRFDVIALNIIGEKTARLRHLVSAFSWDE